MPQFYHFTSLQAFRNMQNVGFMQPDRRMLPLSTSGVSSDHKAFEGAIFGVLHKDAREWWENQFDFDTPLMETVLRDVCTGDGVYRDQIVLLEIEVNSNDDVCVANWGVHLAEDYMGAGFNRKTGEPYTPEEVMVRVKSGYADSLVSLQDYTEKALQYEVPEVVCFSTIPVSRVKRIFQDDRTQFVNRMLEQYGYPSLSASCALGQEGSVYQCAL